MLKLVGLRALIAGLPPKPKARTHPSPGCAPRCSGLPRSWRWWKAPPACWRPERLARCAGVTPPGVLGAIDFALDLDLPPMVRRCSTSPPARLALASRAAGLDAPVAGVSTAIDDAAALHADMRAGARAGLRRQAVHPPGADRPPVHAAWAPTDAQRAQAQRIVDAAAARWRRGVVQVDGRMVDRPVLVRRTALLLPRKPLSRAGPMPSLWGSPRLQGSRPLG